MTQPTAEYIGGESYRRRKQAELACPQGGPAHQPGIVGRKTCAWCDDFYYADGSKP